MEAKESRFASGRHGPAATMQEVARVSGLSRYTVSKVLNDVPTVKPSTRRRVEEACRLLNYVPNAHAAALAKRSTNIIGMVLPVITNPFFGEIVEAAESEARRRDYDLIYQCSYGDAEIERRILKSLRSIGACAIVIAPIVVHSNRRQLTALEAAVPVVYIDRYLKKRCNYIMNDNLGSGAALTQRLLDRGTHPAYLGSSIDPRNMAVVQRGQGYLQTMALNGKAPILVPCSKRSDRRDDSEQAGYEHTVAWLGAGASPTGLFCATDTLALGAMRALRESGREPGVDVLVVGHDDLSFSAFVYPTLTTARQPKAKIGRAAVEVVAECLESRRPSAACVHRIYSSDLIIRESG